MMHPRNIYNTKVDFDDLRKKYPEFAKKTKIDFNGKVKLDFNDPEARMVLTQCCLEKDFSLDVELPKNRLCPTLPLRLNYILFIEDVLAHCKITKDISGVDIGTGASCIYCLLAVRMNKEWKMFALESDQDNVKMAQINVTKNNLDDGIKIIDQAGSDKIFEKLFERDEAPKTFCLCNPPFFASDTEMVEGQNRTGKRPKLQLEKPSHETVFEGGEFSFTKKILEESLAFPDRIQIYSTMFGCKRNFDNFLDLVKEKRIDNFTTTKFIQGKVIRWAVAWSFCHDLKSFKDHLQKSAEKSSTLLKHVIEGKEISSVIERIKEILKNLKIEIEVLTEHANTLYQWELHATENTWSNQRRKRRAEQRNEATVTSSEQQQDLHMSFEVIKGDNERIVIQTQYMRGSMSKDCVNQILQHIKNKMVQN